MRTVTWDKRFLRVAVEVASWSKDPKRKVGCVIVDENNRILSSGHNGLPKQLDAIRKVPNSVKNALTIHSEINALANIRSEVDTTTLESVTAYITYPPCVDCARMLVANLGITRVVWLNREDNSESKWHRSMKAAADYLEDNGVETHGYNRSNIEKAD